MKQSGKRTESPSQPPATVGFGLLLAVTISAGGWLLWKQDTRTITHEETATLSSDTQPELGSAGNYLAALYASRKRDKLTAAESLREALKHKPNDQELLRKAFFVALKAGKMDDALAYAAQLPPETDPDSLDIYVLATGYSLRQLALLAEAVQQGDEESVSRLVHSNISYATERTAFPTMFSSIMRQWLLENLENNWKTLLTSADQVQQLGVMIQSQQALVLERDDKIDQAEALWDTILSADSPLPTWILQQALRFYTTHDKTKKQELLLSTIYDRQKDVWIMTEQWDGWVDYFKRKDITHLDKKRGLSGWWYMSSLLFSSQEDAWMSYHLLNLALYLTPDFWPATMQIAGLQEREKRYMESAQTYLSIPETSPYWPQAQLEAAQNMARAGQLGEAMSIAQNIALAYPQSHVPWLHVGDMLRAESRFLDAANAYEKSIARIEKIDRTDWPLFYMRGICYERADQWDKAEADFLKALELHPNNPDVKNYLGYSWLTKGKHVERATQLITEAVQARPRDGHIVDSMGWALYMLGRYEEAVTHLERAVELMPGDATVTDHLADVYWRLGRTREASFQWERALLFDPEDKLRMEIENKLKHGLPKETNLSEHSKDTPASAE